MHENGFVRLQKRPPAAPTTSRSFRGGGSNASAAATFLVVPAEGTGPSRGAGTVVVESYDRPGMFVAPSGPGASLTLSRTPSRFVRHAPTPGAAAALVAFESEAAPGHYITSDASGSGALHRQPAASAAQASSGAAG